MRRIPRPRRHVPAVLLAAIVLAAGCRGTALREAVGRASAHERYAERLGDAGLDETALGRDWLSAAARALATATPVTPPVREAGYFAAGEPAALAWRVRARRGERIVAAVEVQGSEPAELFLDVFEPPRESGAAPTRVTSADSGVRRVDFEAERDGDYLVRLQPELLRSVRWTVTIEAGPSLAFPVEGLTGRAVQSFWGASRDAGRRLHQGIDIFAPRGTPVLAAAPGIARARVNQLGGTVVFLYDPARRQSLYYAHLDSQVVGAGEAVQTGDTLGFVGNTGNARTTAPHLHFGIYRRGEGAIDPLPFVREPARPAPVIAADTAALGEWRRVAVRGGAPLAAAPARARELRLRDLPPRTVMRVVGASGRYYRVQLPDGTTGYVAAAATAPARTALETTRRDRGAIVRDQPLDVAAVMDSVAPGRPLPVLGRFGEFLFVRAPGGRTGWVVGAD